MFKFLLKNIYNVNPQFFGLDISDKSYKFVQLKKMTEGAGLSTFGYGDIEEGIIKGGEVENEDALAEILINAVKNPAEGKLTTKHVAFSLPEEHSFIRILQLPKMNEEETKEAIKWEIEQNIPLGIDEVYFDWQVVNSGGKKLNHQDILIAAIAKNIADPYISAIRKAGLVGVVMEPESISVARSVIKDLYSDVPTLIVDIGSTTTSFIIFSENTVRFSSSVPIAGNKMIELISDKLKVDKKEAKRLFYDIGFDKKLDKDGKVSEVLDSIFFELTSQLRNYISFYEGHSDHDHNTKDKRIQKILLSGGVANLYGIVTYISSALKIQTEVANPWINILKGSLNEIPSISYRKSLGYTTALGLAIRSLDGE